MRVPAANAVLDAVLSQVYYVGDRIFREARHAAGLRSSALADGFESESTVLDGLLAETLPASFASWERTIDQYLSEATGLGESLGALRNGVDPKLLLAAAALTFAGAEVARRLAEKSAEEDAAAEDGDEALALTLLLDALPDRGA